LDLAIASAFLRATYAQHCEHHIQHLCSPVLGCNTLTVHLDEMAEFGRTFKKTLDATPRVS
jgi:hypothetical protein